MPENRVSVIFGVPVTGTDGSFTIYTEVTGPRGGKSWEQLYKTPATGGLYRTALPEGTRVKVTTVNNNWPSSNTGTVRAIAHDGIEWDSTDNDLDDDNPDYPLPW